MKRTLISLSCIALLIAISIYGYSRYQEQKQFKAKFQEAIGRDSGFTETILKVEQDSSKMTFAELFQLCDKSIEGRNALIVDLRGLYPNFKTDIKAKLIEFLNVENDVTRAKREMYRKSMRLSSAFDLYKEAVNDSPTSSYGYDYYMKHTREKRVELQTAAEESESSAQEFADLYSKALKMESDVQSAAAELGLQYEPTFKKLEKSNRDTSQSTLQSAQLYKTTLSKK